MNMQSVRAMAKQLGIKTVHKKKGDLIREIQRAEGNFDCFESAQGDCDRYDCLFRDMCLQPR